MERAGRYAFWVLAGALAFLLLAGDSVVPLLDPDEARFARTSVEMLRSGDLVVPTFEGAPRIVKPPLVHWIQSTLFRGFGSTELVARIHAVASTMGSLFLLFWVARRRFGDEGAAWAAASFATFPLTVAMGKIGTIDALLSVHVWAVVAVDLGRRDERGGAHRSAAVGALLGLAFLAKGPVGVILPLLAVLAGRTVVGRDPLPEFRGLLAAVAGWCAVVLPWGLAFVARLGSGRVAETVRQEVLSRYFGGTAHRAPFWYYAGVVAVGLAPWSLTLARGCARAIARRRDPSARTAAFAAAGLLVGLVFLSLGTGKLPSYALPLLPLASVVIAWEIGEEVASQDRDRLAPALMVASLTASCAAFAAVAWIAPRPGSRVIGAAASSCLAAAAIAGVAGLARRRARWVHASATLATFAVVTMVVAYAFPLLGRERSAASLAQGVPELRSGRPVVTVEKHIPSLCFYLDRAETWGAASEVDALLERPDRPLFVVDSSDLPSIPAEVRGRMREVGRRGRYLVLEAAPSAPPPRAGGE